jgi:hypothetical protein
MIFLLRVYLYRCWMGSCGKVDIRMKKYKNEVVLIMRGGGAVNVTELEGV